MIRKWFWIVVSALAAAPSCILVSLALRSYLGGRADLPPLLIINLLYTSLVVALLVPFVDEVLRD